MSSDGQCHEPCGVYARAADASRAWEPGERKTMIIGSAGACAACSGWRGASEALTKRGTRARWRGLRERQAVLALHEVCGKGKGQG